MMYVYHTLNQLSTKGFDNLGQVSKTFFQFRFTKTLSLSFLISKVEDF